MSGPGLTWSTPRGYGQTAADALGAPIDLAPHRSTRLRAVMYRRQSLRPPTVPTGRPSTRRDSKPPSLQETQGDSPGGAGGGIRTHMVRGPGLFKSPASASFATPAPDARTASPTHAHSFIDEKRWARGEYLWLLRHSANGPDRDRLRVPGLAAGRPGAPSLSRSWCPVCCCANTSSSGVGLQGGIRRIVDERRKANVPCRP